MATSAQLRELADRLEETEGLVDAAASAKAAYRRDPSPENKTAHRAASQALADARNAVRSSGIGAMETEPGSSTVVPAGVSTKG